MGYVPIPKEEWLVPQGVLMHEKDLYRNEQRVLMHWNASANAGFTIGKPLLRIDRNFQHG